MKYFQMMPMQHQKGIHRYRVVIKIACLLIILSSCKATKTSKDNTKAYHVLNAFLDYYIEKTDRGVFLGPLIISKENHTIINIFNKEEKIHKEICDDTIIDINISNDDFNNYIKKQHISKWDYKRIENKDVVKKLVLEESAQTKYDKAKENAMLKRENEWIIYKYILWHNIKNVPLITLSYPLFSNNGNYALLYMSRYNGGGYVFIMKRETTGKWQVICEKNLFQY